MWGGFIYGGDYMSMCGEDYIERRLCGDETIWRKSYVEKVAIGGHEGQD